MIVTERRKLSEQQLTVRVTLWGALMVVHTLYLLLSFAWAVQPSLWPGDLGVWFAWFALFGLFAPLANAASSLAHQVESQSDGTPSAMASRWMRLRPTFWVLMEILSLAMMSFCAAIIVYVASNAG